MSVTYTTAAERDAHRQRQVTRYALPDPLLVATSCVAVLAIALASVGRLRSFDEAERGRQPVNLNSVRDPNALEPALASVFANTHDRRFAAAALFRFVNGDGERRTLPNVGAIARATVSAKAIRETKDLQSFADRLRVQKDRAPADGEIRLFTPSEIARLKPAMSVRTEDQFRTAVWRFCALYLIAFHIAALR